MAHDATNDELDPGEGKVLPAREMMSLITTDPADPGMFVTPGGPVDAPITGETPPLATLPVEGPDADADSAS